MRSFLEWADLSALCFVERQALPLRIMGHARFGFAAGCEAVAMPRRTSSFVENSGYALGAAFGPLIRGAEPEPGAKPELMRFLRRGIATASHPAAKPRPRTEAF